MRLNNICCAAELSCISCCWGICAPDSCTLFITGSSSASIFLDICFSSSLASLFSLLVTSLPEGSTNFIVSFSIFGIISLNKQRLKGYRLYSETANVLLAGGFVKPTFGFQNLLAASLNDHPDSGKKVKELGSQ